MDAIEYVYIVVIAALLLILARLWLSRPCTSCSRKKTGRTGRTGGGVHLVTFSDRTYAGSRRRLCAEAVRSGMFAPDAVHAYDADADLRVDPDFWPEHGDFVDSHPRGYGYWIWKPYLILKTMREKVPEGDVVVYADAGCTINARGVAGFDRFVELARSGGPDGLVAFTVPDRYGPAEERWTKGRVLEVFADACDAECRAGPQIMATCLVIRNSETNRRMIAEWYRLCTAEGYALVVDENTKAESPTFAEHRHDQSLWSMLVKERVRSGDAEHVTILDDEIENTRPESPIWATRRKNVA